MKDVYFDNDASAPPIDEVCQAMCATMREASGNPARRTAADAKPAASSCSPATASPPSLAPTARTGRARAMAVYYGVYSSASKHPVSLGAAASPAADARESEVGVDSAPNLSRARRWWRKTCAKMIWKAFLVDPVRGARRDDKSETRHLIPTALRENDVFAMQDDHECIADVRETQG